jgi:L-alanine-DL-glutamate epimerase-like enolase superfamily enzyme
LKLTWTPLTLDLKTTFRIAHGASDQRHNVITQLQWGDYQGLGEAPGVAYHGETQAGIQAYLAQVNLNSWDDPCLLDEIVDSLPEGSRAARAGIDLALHDVWGKFLGAPLYRLLGVNPLRIPLTSFTIAMDEPAQMAERARVSGFPIIKIKLGSEQDLQIVAAIREAVPARLRVDTNAGWTRSQAAHLLPRLADFGVELVEQPLAVGDLEGLRMLQGLKTGLPIFADESIRSAQDVIAHAGAVDGVVIKLAKSGGIRPALASIHTARALGMQVMLGCMVETSLGVTAAAHLAPLCDYVDLDGPLLIRNDPFDGLQYAGEQLILKDLPGLGVVPKPGAVS